MRKLCPWDSPSMLDCGKNLTSPRSPGGVQFSVKGLGMCKPWRRGTQQNDEASTEAGFSTAVLSSVTWIACLSLREASFRVWLVSYFPGLTFQFPFIPLTNENSCLLGTLPTPEVLAPSLQSRWAAWKLATEASLGAQTRPPVAWLRKAQASHLPHQLQSLRPSGLYGG